MLVGSHIIIYASWWYREKKEKKGREEKKEGSKKMAHALQMYSEQFVSWGGERGVGKQLPSLHLAVPDMGLGQRERSETGQSANCKDMCCKESALLGLTAGVSGTGKGSQKPRLGCSRCFLRSLEQQGSQGCRRYLIFFSWKMGFTWFALGQALGLRHHLAMGVSETAYQLKIDYTFSSCLWH